MALRGKVPEGLPYSAWQLVEHMRLTQADILEFCVSRVSGEGVAEGLLAFLRSASNKGDLERQRLGVQD